MLLATKSAISLIEDSLVPLALNPNSVSGCGLYIMKEFWIKQSNFRQFHGGANRQGAWSDDDGLDYEDDWEAMLEQGAFDDAFSTDDTTSAETSSVRKKATAKL